MTLRVFIREHRETLDVCILKALGREHSEGKTYTINDEERRLWILNDEGLYNWARSEGVRI